MPVLRSCPICSGRQFHRVVTVPSRRRPMAVVACDGCALVFVNPTYTEAEKAAASPHLVALHRSNSVGRSRAALRRQAEPRTRRCLEALNSYVRPGDRVLEVGFGDGLLLAELQARGAEPVGAELDAHAAWIGRQLGVPVHVGPFEQIEFSGGRRFDAVVMVHLIEHFFNPVAALRKVHRLLKPGGIVFLETPNLLRPKVGPRRVFSFAHNYHFTPRTLAAALHAAGFRCCELREFRRDAFQVVARACRPGEFNPAPLAEDPAESIAAVRRHARRYYTSLQFFWRKSPWGRRWMNQLHRHLRTAELNDWLTGAPRPQLIAA
ncbi:MAG: class I SAM-dependent methyltransferase [Gemmataceae bacterium]